MKMMRPENTNSKFQYAGGASYTRAFTLIARKDPINHHIKTTLVLNRGHDDSSEKLHENPCYSFKFGLLFWQLFWFRCDKQNWRRRFPFPHHPLVFL